MATHSSTLARKIPWEKPGVGCSPWGCKESDTTERLYLLTSGNLMVTETLNTTKRTWALA